MQANPNFALFLKFISAFLVVSALIALPVVHHYFPDADFSQVSLVLEGILIGLGVLHASATNSPESKPSNQQQPTLTELPK